MNDRFKFKCVINNKVKDVFYFYELLTNKKIVFACTNLEDNKGHYIPKCQLMQSIGLKDKNGKLIYEGDIVKYAEFDWTDFSLKDLETKTAEVVYGVDYDNYYPAFDLKDTDFDGTNAFAYLFNEGWTVEVIGNKFENPELLKECE